MSRIEPEVEGIDFPDEADHLFANDAAREVVREKLVELKVHGAADATDSELVSGADAHYCGGLDALLAAKAPEIERRLGMSIYAVRMLHMRGDDKGQSFTFQTSASTAKGGRSKARSAHPTATPTATRRISKVIR